MKPTHFIITIPTKGWSKHDKPADTQRILREAMKKFLKKWEETTGFVPFDMENISVAPVLEVRRETSSKG